MQLPPTDEIVMVSGAPPIRAKKARYFEDRRFKERILPPPDLAVPRSSPAVASADDWSSRELAFSSETATTAGHGEGDGDPVNAGIRREPELPEHEEIVPPSRPPEQEFDVLEDEPDVDAAKARALRQRMRIVARQASMNPADGIEL